MLLNDGDIARRLGVAKSTVRGQRHRRKTGQDHWFKLDPVFLGRCPRYRAEDFEAFLSTLECKGRADARSVANAE